MVDYLFLEGYNIAIVLYNQNRRFIIVENQTKATKEIKETICRMLAGINSRADLLRIKKLVQYIYYKR